jgi:hypothetical protein
VEFFRRSWFSLSTHTGVTGRRTGLDYIQQVGHEQTIGNTSQVQDSGWKDDEGLSFSLAQPSIYL